MPLGAHKAAIMGVAGVSTGDVVLLSTQTADGDTTISFTSDIDSTYGEYIFKFYNINPETDGAHFQFQVNAVGASGYNETITSSGFYASHTEADATGFQNVGGTDQGNGTAFQGLATGIGSGADEDAAGEMHLFNPSSTTYVKHWHSRSSMYGSTDFISDGFFAGYFNITAAIDDVQFKMSAGDFEGKIKMWGVK